jgi:hypothetical protein
MHKKHAAMKYAILSALTLGLSVMAAKEARAAFTVVGTPVSNTASVQLTQAGTVSMTVSLKNMSDNATATSIGWSGVTLPTGWKNANQYIQLDTVITANGGGVQILTDNKNSSPAYTGSTTTAAGLVDNSNTTKTLQMAWSVKDTVVGSTGPVSSKPFDAIHENPNTAPVNEFQWLYMTDAFNDTPVNGDSYRTVVNNDGIHFGGGTTDYGAADSPNMVYLEANFGTAVTPNTYSTTKLLVEAFTQ